jgi:MFS family permease
MTQPQVFSTNIPARLDRLPWSRFHWLVVISLGITWILDGLEVTIVGSLAGVLVQTSTLALTASQIGLAGSTYIAGAVLGALLFGDLTDRYGRRTLFMVTLGVYLVSTVTTGFSWNFLSFAAFRFLTGAGIGGEYAAINSAIQEFVPARYRGRTDLIVNGSFWIGAAFGALGSVVVLDPAIFPVDIGWRLAFIIGGLLAVIVIALRRFVPESPRWLMTHGRMTEAEAIMSEIETRIVHERGVPLADVGAQSIRFGAYGGTHLGDVVRALVKHYPQRTVLGLTLMATQAFCYNAIFFTYALILTKFYDVPAPSVGWFILPFAVGNFMGPILLGHLFDIVGRKVMIASTYAISGILMAATGWLFALGVVGPIAQTALWSVNFFFASCAASAAYLTVGECFPLEVRARAISIFYAFGTALGGIAGPAVFGVLIETGARVEILWGYLFGGALMVMAAIVEGVIGVSAECVGLEDVARPLSRVG